MASRVLFIASTGGHLEELKKLRPMVCRFDDEITWVTFDSLQSRSLLSREPRVIYVPEVPPRGFFQLIAVLLPALRILLRERPRAVVSTGAAIALAFLPLAFLVRARATYIESATRTDGPSITGRLLQFAPWVRLRTQYRTWASKRWQFAGSVFDQWQSVPVMRPLLPIKRVVVTLGTQDAYPFVSLVERMQQIVPDGVEVLWQLGGGFPEASRPVGARDLVPASELREWVNSADAIVAHAGVGSALTLLGSGRTPVLVPRSATRGEHVDEHQAQLAVELTQRGLAICASPLDLTWNDLVQSTAMAIEPVPVGGAVPARHAVRTPASAA